MYKRVFFGPIVSDGVAAMQDINWLEATNYILLAIGVFFLGLYPAPVLQVLHATIEHIFSISMPA